MVKPDLRNLSFLSVNFSEGSQENRTRQCQSYGEAASAISIDLDRGHFFKIFYKGFSTDVLTWLPYDEDEDNNLVLPFIFRFKSGCTDASAASIFDCIIKPCALPTEFRHGREKIGTGRYAPLPTYEFYNPSFVARQFGLGQLPPQLVFLDILKPREGISDGVESNRV